MQGIIAIIQLVGAFVSGVAGPILVWWLKEHYSDDEEENAKSTLNEEVEFAQNISDELEDIREDVKADRVWVAQFHNGGQFLESIQDTSMKRLSVTHEVTNAGVSKEQHTFSGVLVSFFSKMIGKLMQTDYINYTEEHVEVDPEVELLFRQRGTECMHLFAMRNIDGVLIGMMGVDYLDREEELETDEVQYLKAKASLLAGYIFYGHVGDINNE